MADSPIDRGAVKPARTMVVGLDGASFELLNPWIKSGAMPNLARLVETGASGGLESVVPPLTPPAWMSAVTGVSPGKHGIYNFFRPLFGRSGLEIYGSNHLRAPALWDLLGALGRQSIVLHLPATHPPRPLAGYLVAGFPITNMDGEWSYPPELKSELLREVSGYRLYPDTMKIRTDLDEYYRQSIETVRIHADEALYLMESRDWSLLFTLWHMGDPLKHYFWRDMTGQSGNAERRDYIRDYYREADVQLGRLLEKAGPETHVVVMSDHGHQGVNRAIHVNGWLAQHGYLKVQVPKSLLAGKLLKKIRRKLGIPGGRSGPGDRGFFTSLKNIDAFEKAIVWAETSAYAERPGFIRINLKGREPHGIVEPGDEYRDLCELLREQLQGIRDPETNDTVFDDVVTADEAFGPGAGDDAPDLVVLPKTGYITEYGVQRPFVVGPARRAGFNGYHVMRGMVALGGPSIEAGRRLTDARILDIAPTILYLLDLPVPPSMDGRVLEDAITEACLAERSIRREEIAVDGLAEPEAEADRDELERSLRDLGYM